MLELPDSKNQKKKKKILLLSESLCSLVALQHPLCSDIVQCNPSNRPFLFFSFHYLTGGILLTLCPYHLYSWIYEKIFTSSSSQGRCYQTP